MDTPFLLFLGISAIVIMTPGQDTALSLRNTVAGGRAAGVATAVGVATGQLLWAVAAALGLVAILAAADTLFAAIKYAGAVYLIFLGIQSLKAALIGSAPSSVRSNVGALKRLSTKKAFTQGIVSNLGNPKMAIFFASLLPQFVPQGAPAFAAMMGLGVIFCTMTLLWLGFYAFCVTWAGQFLQRPTVRRSVDGVMGIALIGLGFRVSLLDR